MSANLDRKLVRGGREGRGGSLKEREGLER